VDTAGLRHRRKVSEAVDFFAMGRTMEAIQRCDVAILLVDAGVGLARDDRRIITKVVETGCGLILAVNKWDLVKDGKPSVLQKSMHRAVPQASFAPVMAISAKTGFQLHLIVPEALRVAGAMRETMTPEACTALLQSAWRKQPPTRFRGRPVTLKSSEWIPGRPVKIRIRTAPPGGMQEPYRRFLLKFLYAQQERFTGVPIHLLTQEPDFTARPSRRAPKRRRSR
jgi:GTP-binding protein